MRGRKDRRRKDNALARKLSLHRIIFASKIVERESRWPSLHTFSLAIPLSFSLWRLTLRLDARASSFPALPFARARDIYAHIEASVYGKALQKCNVYDVALSFAGGVREREDEETRDAAGDRYSWGGGGGGPLIGEIKSRSRQSAAAAMLLLLPERFSIGPARTVRLSLSLPFLSFFSLARSRCSLALCHSDGSLTCLPHLLARERARSNGREEKLTNNILLYQFDSSRNRLG